MKKAALLVAAAVLVPTASQASVVWKADFETGDRSQFNGRIQMVSPDRLKIVTSPVAEGRYALQATVQQGDDPINASGNRNELVHSAGEREGDEYYYRFLVRFDEQFPAPNTWQLFTQWHHTGLTGSPPLEFVVMGEQLQFVHNSPSGGTTTRMPLGPLVRGQWIEFVLQVKWSPKASEGFVQVWRDREVKIARRSFATMFPGEGVYMKAGLYRNDTIGPVGVLQLDGYLQTTTLDEAMPRPLSAGPAPQTPAPGTPAETGSTGSSDSTEVTQAPEALEDGTLTANAQAGCAAAGAGPAGLMGLTLLGLLRRRRR